MSELAAIDWSGLPRVVGRMHPIGVHFPVALLIVGAILEVWRVLTRRESSSRAGMTCIILGTIGAAGSVTAGLLNAYYEPHGAAVADEVEWHRWFGIATLVLALATAACAARSVKTRRAGPGWRRAYVGLVILTACVVGFTGHLGGSITYGADYVYAPLFKPSRPVGVAASDATTPPPQPISSGLAGPKVADNTSKPTTPRPIAPIANGAAIDFVRDVEPIFAARCVICHGPTKKKGNLRLDSADALFAGEEADWVVLPGKPDDSELLKRVQLPGGDDSAMPPEGEGERLTRDEVATIRAWIQQGAKH